MTAPTMRDLCEAVRDADKAVADAGAARVRRIDGCVVEMDDGRMIFTGESAANLARVIGAARGRAV